MNKKITIPVVGMACSSCSAHVEKKLNSLEGVKMASVSLSSRSALVEYEPSVITLQ
ncbi:MAG: heavy-metal-associated domain-containing protein, partial [Prevotella sp.]|nr:heavy-metal-associated domain-containing protein [Prevotella sp.]